MIDLVRVTQNWKSHIDLSWHTNRSHDNTEKSCLLRCFECTTGTNSCLVEPFDNKQHKESDKENDSEEGEEKDEDSEDRSDIGEEDEEGEDNDDDDEHV
jgi:heterodisulfide reductase subunit C